MYLYNQTGNAFGEPIIVANSTTIANGGTETFNFTADYTGTYYLVVKRSTEDTGEGNFTLTSRLLGAVLRPNGDYSVTLQKYGGDGSTHYSCVNEAVHDDGASYVCSPVTDSDPHEDEFGIDNYTFPSGANITSAVVNAWVKGASATYQATVRLFYVKNGTKTYGSYVNPATSYSCITLTISGLQPSEVNSLRIGVEITSQDYKDMFYVGFCTQLYLEIDYST